MSFLSGFRNWCKGPQCKQNKQNETRAQNEKNKTRKRIHYDTLRNAESKERREFLGFGASGFTYGVYTEESKYPTHVYRVSFKGNLNNARAIHNKAQSMARITGNTRQIVEIVEGFTVNDLPPSIPARMIHKIDKTSILSVIRMPYLGIDLFDAIKYDNNITMIRNLPITTLMIQCYKLMKQIDALRRQQTYHGDIRLENITIHPETGKMTLIDFEFHDTFEAGFNKYIGIDERLTEISERIPPEFLSVSAAAVAPYGIKNISKYYLNDRMLLFLWYINEKNAEKYFEDSYVSNMAFLYSLFEKNNNVVTKTKKISNVIMDYFDFFGFGIAMTMFFSTLYPMNMFFNKLYSTNIHERRLCRENVSNQERRLCRENVSNQEIIESFRTMCKKHRIYSKNISESQIVAFYDMRVLLITMCDFSRKNRPEPYNVLTMMEQIMTKITPIIPEEGRQERSIFKAVRQVPRIPKALSQASNNSIAINRASKNSIATNQTAKRHRTDALK